MATQARATGGQASGLGVALAFLGMFVVGSLAVQLVATAPGARASRGSAPVETVTAHPASLWQTLGER